MAREFQRSLDDMAREADLQDIKAEVDQLSRVDVRHRLEETIDPEGELRRGLAAPAGENPHPEQPSEMPVANDATTDRPVALPEPVAAPMSGMTSAEKH
jgi:sec-independent protein translocase protein TatB